MASSYNEDLRFCPSTCKQEDSVLKKTPVWGAFMKRCVFSARFHRIRVMTIREEGVMNGPLKFLTARKILPLLDLLAKFKRVLACSCSPNFCVARKLAKQIFYFCSCSQKIAVFGVLANARKDHSSPLQNTILPQPSLLMVYYMNKKSFLLGLQFDFTVCCS